MRRIRFSELAALCAVLLPAAARAQSTVQKSFDTQLFEPAIGTHTLLSIEPGSVADHLVFGVGLMLNYQHKPLSVYVQNLEGGAGAPFEISNAEEISVVSSQMTADLGGALGLHYRWLHTQVGLSMPINLVVAGNEVNDDGARTGDLNATGIGDLRLQLKAALLRGFKGFSLAFSPIITLPTGKDSGFGGEPTLTFRPRFVADYRFGKFLFAANLGWLFRENTTIFSSEVGDQLLYGLGASYQVHRRAVLIAEATGRAGFSTKSGCTRGVDDRVVCTNDSGSDIDAFPLEALLGGRLDVGRGLQVSAGMGFGLVQAIGSPNFRLLAGLRWVPDFTDTDKDGVYDGEDSCPTQPEDRDGFQDDDGCPDPDNDSDLIPDTMDKCPNEAEDKDTFQDDDGCPDLDNDADGVPDVKDSCPFKPETKNGFRDDDGCPDVPDSDNDGVPDTQDRCPKELEDRDGFQDDDGCPDPDNDADGVPDQYDDCPLKPEDADGFQDDDGCPDPDNDGDGVLDAKDKCPNEPETINGVRDDDGCPDRGKSKVTVTESKIVIADKVYFSTNRAKIQRRSFSILNQVALTLVATPRIRGLRIEGHTDSQGVAERNKRLSQARAEAVRDYLIQRGVEPGRLFAVGYGQDRPIDDNKTARGRAKNRRVEFTILDLAPTKPQKADTE